MNNSGPEKLQTVYFQNLDAARFIAAFSVFLLHFSNEIRGLFPEVVDLTSFKLIYLFTSKGGLGVDFFFVLSGFLITFLIFNEKQKYGRFHLGYFLIRRTLRIWPLYFLIGIIGFLLFPLLINGYQTAHDPLLFFFFLANFDELWHGTNDTINFLTSPWSVAVEEQFYLFWGVLLSLGFRFNKIKFPFILLILFVVSFAFSWIHRHEINTLYFHTLIVCQDILLGSFLGWSVFKGLNWIRKIQELSRPKLFVIYVLGILIILAKNKIFQGDFHLIERLIFAFFFGFIILDQIGGKNSIIKFGHVKLFTQLGKISYGIYMYHLVIMYLLIKNIQFQSLGLVNATLLLGVLSAILTYIVSWTSYRFIETKFLALKPKVNSK